MPPTSVMIFYYQCSLDSYLCSNTRTGHSFSVLHGQLLSSLVFGSRYTILICLILKSEQCHLLYIPWLLNCSIFDTLGWIRLSWTRLALLMSCSILDLCQQEVSKTHPPQSYNNSRHFTEALRLDWEQYIILA
jgi:hypothetical protein